MELISQFEAQLCVVPRWSIVHTIQKQSVAEHSFRVALMVPRIYKWLWGLDASIELQRAALLHDQEESFTGDIPAPAKGPMGYSKEGVEQRYKPFINESFNLDHYEKAVIKIADLIEGVYFMQWETLLGNCSVYWIRDDLVARLRDTMEQCNAHNEFNIIMKWIGALGQQDPLDENSPRNKAPF